MKTAYKLAWAIIPLSVSINLYADQQIQDDLIVVGSACIGQDCVNGENFSFDTLRLKENNLRIKFQDTSSSGSFPTNDWQLTANDSANGGLNKFSIDDVDSGRTPFTIMAGAKNNSLFVASSGRIGVGTSTPVVPLHVVDGNTPAMRLEQDGSSGFSAQTWDVAGNETNFFIRDVTNGSKLPFKIVPGAPTNSLYIDSNGDMGLGTSSPDSKLHLRGTNGSTALHIDEKSTSEANGRVLLRLTNNGSPRIEFENTANPTTLFQINGNINDTFVITNKATDTKEFTLDSVGNLTLTGALTTSGAACLSTPCDGVFKSDEFQVESIEEHADYMWKNAHLVGVGPTGKNEPFNLTEKTVGILHELEKAHIYIEQLNKKIVSREEAIENLNKRLEKLERNENL